MPMFLYQCATCCAPAKKSPLVNDPKWREMQGGRDYKGLGGWTCTNGCGRGVKVTHINPASQLAKAA